MPRRIAWQILRSGSTTPMREVDRFARAARLDARDRAFLRTLVGTEVRRRATLRALVEHFTRRKPSPDLAAHLRLGLAQVFFLDSVPDHAAVSESVHAVVETLSLSKGKFVNAVLRAAIRARRAGTSGDPRRDVQGRDLHLEEPVFVDPNAHPLVWAEQALSIPAPLLKRWRKRFGHEEAVRLARLALDPPFLSLRVTRGELEATEVELLALDVAVHRGEHPRVLLVPHTGTDLVLGSRAFAEGRLTVQGATALRAAELVGARPGERVLDLCAAPGGKTAVLAEKGAHVTACDLDGPRLERLASTLERLGLEDRVEIRSASRDDLPRDYDAALADVPCSNTGVLAQRPGARWRFGPTASADLHSLQAALLGRAASSVRPGGRLVYSTCSLEGDENRQRVRAFLEAHPEWRLDEEIEALPRALEDGGPVDGGYAARLVLGAPSS